MVRGSSYRESKATHTVRSQLPYVARASKQHPCAAPRASMCLPTPRRPASAFTRAALGLSRHCLASVQQQIAHQGTCVPFARHFAETAIPSTTRRRCDWSPPSSRPDGGWRDTMLDVLALSRKPYESPVMTGRRPRNGRSLKLQRLALILTPRVPNRGELWRIAERRRVRYFQAIRAYVHGREHSKEPL